MEYQDVVISESGEEEITETCEEVVQQIIQENKEEDEPAVHGDKNKILEEERKWQEERVRDMEYLWGEGSLEYSLNLIEHRLEERRSLRRMGQRWNSSVCIFRLPDTYLDINCKAQQPEIVSIGPYHRGKENLLEFEEHKWLFLERLLSRPGVFRMDLNQYLRKMRQMEKRARDCYSESVPMSTHDFVEMMLLDSCFVIELFRYIDRSRTDMFSTGNPIYGRPWLIPVLIRDLFKLENQLPLFVLESFFIASKSPEEYRSPRSFCKLVLEVFALVSPGLVSPMLSDTITFHQDLKAKHLLDFLHSSLLPQNQVTIRKRQDEYHRSGQPGQSIQSVTQLRPSGIKFKSRKAESLLDIKYQKGVLEIPTITINDVTASVLINCVAWEECLEDDLKYFSHYVSFMNCLISQPRDVAFLCSDGIISRFSNDDQYVANLFNNLAKSKVFNNRDCYLWKEFKEIQAYYCSNWATTRRTYFSSPWSFILVFSAFFLIALTMIQTAMSVLSYQRQFG